MWLSRQNICFSSIWCQLILNFTWALSALYSVCCYSLISFFMHWQKWCQFFLICFMLSSTQLMIWVLTQLNWDIFLHWLLIMLFLNEFFSPLILALVSHFYDLTACAFLALVLLSFLWTLSLISSRLSFCHGLHPVKTYSVRLKDVMCISTQFWQHLSDHICDEMLHCSVLKLQHSQWLLQSFDCQIKQCSKNDNLLPPVIESQDQTTSQYLDFICQFVIICAESPLHYCILKWEWET